MWHKSNKEETNSGLLRVYFLLQLDKLCLFELQFHLFNIYSNATKLYFCSHERN